jgi:hypothetical protein
MAEGVSDRDRDAGRWKDAAAICGAGNGTSTVATGDRGTEAGVSKTDGVGFPVCRREAAFWVAASAAGVGAVACRTGVQGDWLRLATESRSESGAVERLPSTAENTAGEASVANTGAVGMPSVEPGATSGWLRSLARDLAKAADDGVVPRPPDKGVPDSGAAPAGG